MKFAKGIVADCCHECTHRMESGQPRTEREGRIVHAVCPPLNPARPYPLAMDSDPAAISFRPAKATS